MDTTEFLRLVWPDAGPYCLLTISPNDKKIRRHIVKQTVEEAAEEALALRSKADVYFCLHALKQPRVWNPHKKNWKGEEGTWQVRTHANMKDSACFFLDLDVGDESEKFTNQKDALAGLKTFCQQTKLPVPTLVLSGRGVHVYWPLSESIPSDEWRREAHKLKLLTEHFHLKVDPTRVEDQSSVLRVPGTLHHKDPSNPRPVVLLNQGSTTDTTVFLKLLADAVSTAGIATEGALISGTPVDATGWASNLDIEHEGVSAPPSIESLIKACNQVKWMVSHQAQCSEPMWYSLLGAVRFVEDGKEWCHVVSKLHPGYTVEQTNVKIQQSIDARTPEGKPLGPTRCGRLQSVSGEGAARCVGCPFQNLPDKSPIMRARDLENEAPAPTVLHTVEGDVENVSTIPINVPPPPEGYTRLKGGGISSITVNKDGKEVKTVIYPYDLYPYQIINNAVAEKKLVTWRTWLPKRGEIDFVTTVEQLYDARTFIDAVGNAGVFILYDDLTSVRAYMIAYIRELEKYTEDHQQHAHLGWTEDCTKFVLPEYVLTKEGATKAIVTQGVAVSGAAVGKRKGSLAAQIDLLRFYDHDAYVARQFFICCSLGAPLFYMTGHDGVLVNMSGETGASKSTSLYTGASFWGKPKEYVINGTNRGMTANARYGRATVLSSLPVCVDEITALTKEEAIDLALSVTQTTGRGRLGRNGEEKRSVNDDKSTIMMTTGNNSLHEILSQANAAGTAASMRVFEIACQKLHVHHKWDADEYLLNIMQNYGHIAPVFMQHVLQDQESVAKRVREIMGHIDRVGNVDQGERFWSGVGATAWVACELSHKHGLLPYHPDTIAHWLIKNQLPNMRGVVTSSYSTPLDCLLEYVEQIAGDILCVQTGANGVVSVQKGVGREIAGRNELDTKRLYIAFDRFKTHCRRQGFVISSVVDYLAQAGIAHKTRMTLGKGHPEYAHGQIWTLCIDQKHPAVTGRPELHVINNPQERPLQIPDEDAREDVSGLL